MRKRPFIFWVTMFSFMIQWHVACADEGDIVVYPLVINVNTVENSPKFSDISITNLDKENPNFVQISVQKRTETQNGAVWEAVSPTPDRSDLGISWSKAAVPPGGVRVLRVIDFAEHAPVKDEVYEITVTPTVPAFVRQAQVPAHQIHGHLNLIFAYKVLVILRPTHPEAILQALRQDDKVVLHNIGNTEALLEDIQICSKKDADCTSLPPDRVFPDESVTFHVPKEGQIHFVQEVEGHELPVVF